MYANFTEETCTGTGDTLALSGATQSRIPFSKSFADGDLVAYVLEDSVGTIRVAGVGIYVSATDDITRNDTWNWNGTVTDESPTSNITLSGGTHIIRCDIVASKADNIYIKTESESDEKYANFPAVSDVAFPDITTPVAVSNIYEPFLESDWPLMMEDKSWYDEEGYGVDGVYHSTVTTTERDALSPSQGDVCYNSTTAQFEKYSGSAWAVTYRGNTRQFPARAVAIAEASKVIIYDLTQNEPVMWMVFNTGSGFYLGGAATIGSVELSGGVLFVGTTTNGLNSIFLLEDRGTYRLSNAHGNRSKSISDRNITNSGIGIDSIYLINSAVNDIATTQLDNAPVDEYGVKAVTWAVATDGGVSVGKIDGNVWDSLNVGVMNEVAFIEGKLFYSRIFGRLQTADIPNADGYGHVNGSGTSAQGCYHISSIPALNVSGLSDTPSVISNSGIVVSGELKGITLLKENLIDPTQGMVNYLTTLYQSGWMHGDIKGAWLSDNDDTDAVGTELVINGDFSTALGAEWYTIDTGAGTFDIVSGEGELVDSGGTITAKQDITTVAGVTYVITYDTFAAREVHVTVKDNDTTTIGTVIGYTGTRIGAYGFSFTALSANTTILLNDGTGGDSTTTFDNVSIKLADSDRSVNGNGLQVNGTITKTRLGGDNSLVAYSGFSSSNYLEQPYNSDLDFGTDDFYVMGWLEMSSIGSHERILIRLNSANTIGVIVEVRDDGRILFQIKDASSNTSIYIPTISVNQKVFVCFTRTESGATINGYIDGEFILSDSGNVIDTTSDNTAIMAIGENPISTRPLTNGALALWRIGAGAPSAEDIEYIYKQEKPLIVNGADAVLGGSSDAIAALAWDDYKKQLYTQSGDTLSVIQGSTVVKTIASTNTLIEVSDGEEVNI